jgi:hypothetical protein
MYLLIIFLDYSLGYRNNGFHVFSTKDDIEEWLNEHYKYQVIPEYKIIEFKEIDPDPEVYPYELD